MNIIQIAGHLGADPEVRFTANGLKVTHFRVATNMRKGNKDETIWYRVTIFGDRFDKMMSYMKKGSSIIVVGELKPDIYVDKEGRPQLSLEIVAEFIRFSPFGKSGGDRGQEGAQPGNYPAGQGAQPGTYSGGFGNEAKEGDFGYNAPYNGGFSTTPANGSASHSGFSDDDIPF